MAAAPGRILHRFRTAAPRWRAAPGGRPPASSATISTARSRNTRIHPVRRLQRRTQPVAQPGIHHQRGGTHIQVGPSSRQVCRRCTEARYQARLTAMVVAPAPAIGAADRHRPAPPSPVTAPWPRPITSGPNSRVTRSRTSGLAQILRHTQPARDLAIEIPCPAGRRSPAPPMTAPPARPARPVLRSDPPPPPRPTISTRGEADRRSTAAARLHPAPRYLEPAAAGIRQPVAQGGFGPAIRHEGEQRACFLPGSAFRHAQGITAVPSGISTAPRLDDGAAPGAGAATVGLGKSEICCSGSFLDRAAGVAGPLRPKLPGRPRRDRHGPRRKIAPVVGLCRQIRLIGLRHVVSVRPLIRVRAPGEKKVDKERPHSSTNPPRPGVAAIGTGPFLRSAEWIRKSRCPSFGAT